MYVGRHLIAVIPFWGKTDPAYLHGLKVDRLSFVELRKARLFALRPWRYAGSVLPQTECDSSHVYDTIHGLQCTDTTAVKPT